MDALLVTGLYVAIKAHAIMLLVQAAGIVVRH
jgi:hypothetical protein